MSFCKAVIIYIYHDICFCLRFGQFVVAREELKKGEGHEM